MDRAFKDAKSQLEQALKALQSAHSMEMEKVRHMALEAMTTATSTSTSATQSPKKKTAAEVVATGTQLMPTAQQEAFRLVAEVRALRADLETEVRTLAQVTTIIVNVQAPPAPPAPVARAAPVAPAAAPKAPKKVGKKKVSELEAQTDAEVLERCILGLQTQMDQALKENLELSRKLAEQQLLQQNQQLLLQETTTAPQPQGASSTVERKLRRQLEVEHRRAERLEAELLKHSVHKADDGRREKEVQSLRTEVQTLQLQVALIPEKDAIIADQLQQMQQLKLHLEYARIMESCSHLPLPDEPLAMGPPRPPPAAAVAGSKKKPHHNNNAASSKKTSAAMLMTLSMTDQQVLEALQQIYHNPPPQAPAAK